MGTRIGLIGCGKQAEKHISGLLAIGATPVLADVDLSAAQRLAERFDLEFVESPGDLFETGSQIDGIDICVPTPFHAPLILRSIDRDIPFFVEKPLATSYSEASELLAASEASGVPGMVGYVYRFAPAFVAGHELIQSGALGPLSAASFRIGGRGSHQPWKHQIATGGGAINEMLVHMIDLMIWYFGRVETVDLLRSERKVPKRIIGGVSVDCDAEDYVVAVFGMQSGLEVLVQADMISRSFLQFVDVQGENGTFVGSISPDYGSFAYLDSPSGEFAQGKTPIEIPKVDLYIDQMSEFVGIIQDRSRRPRTTLNDSVHLLQVVEQVREKAQELANQGR